MWLSPNLNLVPLAITPSGTFHVGSVRTTWPQSGRYTDVEAKLRLVVLPTRLPISWSGLSNGFSSVRGSRGIPYTSDVLCNNMCICNYRRLSLSQSLGDQTKYFELSIVWDSQFVTSFALYMYTDGDYNLYVHVFGNDVVEFKYPLTELLISDTNFEKAVTEIKKCWWLLTSKNAVKQCSITKVKKATLCTLWVQSNALDCVIVWTVSVITAG